MREHMFNMLGPTAAQLPEKTDQPAADRTDYRQDGRSIGYGGPEFIAGAPGGLGDFVAIRNPWFSTSCAMRGDSLDSCQA